MIRFRRASSDAHGGVWLIFWCPGCQMPHGSCIERPENEPDRPVWTFNGDWDQPTISPSLLVHVDGRSGTKKCHSFLELGWMRFLADCWHDLKNQTVDVPEWPKETT